MAQRKKCPDCGLVFKKQGFATHSKYCKAKHQQQESEMRSILTPPWTPVTDVSSDSVNTQGVYYEKLYREQKEEVSKLQFKLHKAERENAQFRIIIADIGRAFVNAFGKEL